MEFYQEELKIMNNIQEKMHQIQQIQKKILTRRKDTKFGMQNQNRGKIQNFAINLAKYYHKLGNASGDIVRCPVVPACLLGLQTSNAECLPGGGRLDRGSRVPMLD